MSDIQQWFDGVYLVGQFNWLRTGCWLLAHGGEAAVLEMPPAGLLERSPADAAKDAAAALGVRVKYLLCTHAHHDHYSRTTHGRMRVAFPGATTHLQRGFDNAGLGVTSFDDHVRLDLAGEPLLLVHAPKHSETDTMVIFRGSACTGDWELGMLASVHDGKPWGVPAERKRRSIDRLARFPDEQGYTIHSTYSVHANDKREGVDFRALIESCRREGA